MLNNISYEPVTLLFSWKEASARVNIYRSQHVHKNLSRKNAQHMMRKIVMSERFATIISDKIISVHQIFAGPSLRSMLEGHVTVRALSH